ncbi:predicted protein [Arabidopsis lyrata subsp. lyrata]|uniref:Predicted protein n=1 Tax=Arabidopsis lyrata subsp. lyrata TaxID=81972 RepID=D7L1T8_ARALL|nr:predicted protein [Arabidopsis lyrata subsp. lyrata]
MSSSSSFSSNNWRYDVFLNFRGEDVRKTFLSHFLKELDRKLISFFQDNKIEKSQSLGPVLNQAIKDSRIAIVVFSKKYASSRWCLNELVEIVKCKNKLGQHVIPVFYDLDPTDVRNKTGDFGNIFDRTCHNKTEDEIRLWREALTDEVRKVGIWGPSGIGKTTIARALFSRLSHHFQGRVFIDMRFISKSVKDYSKGNPTDYNMKLHLQRKFLSKILDKEGIKLDHLGAVKGKLKHHKVLIIIDDLDDQVVLDALAGGDEWFGSGSRIIAITKDKHILRAHGITYSELNVDIGLQNLVDMSLIHVIPSLEMSIIEMHCLVEQMGKEIVREQSNNPGEREFLLDWKNVCDVLENKTGSNTVQGIPLNLDEIDELRIHKKAFKKMSNLKFLNIYTTTFGGNKETRWHLQEDFDYLPPKLKFLSWEKYPLRSMPSNFQPKNLVKLQMMNSNLEKLWEGVHSLTGLKDMDLWGSKKLKEIPDLSMVTNLETLNLGSCSSLVELPSSIKYLNKLIELNMSYCTNLEILPTGLNLKSLQCLYLWGCSQLKTFPDISTNISDLNLGESAIEEFPSNLHLENLDALEMFSMKNGKLWERVQIFCF